MWKYKTGEFVMDGDKVLVSKKWAEEHNGGGRNAIVVGRHGFVTVQFLNGTKIDLDMRSLSFVSRKAN